MSYYRVNRKEWILMRSYLTIFIPRWLYTLHSFKMRPSLFFFISFIYYLFNFFFFRIYSFVKIIHREYRGLFFLSSFFFTFFSTSFLASMRKENGTDPVFKIVLLFFLFFFLYWCLKRFN